MSLQVNMQTSTYCSFKYQYKLMTLRSHCLHLKINYIYSNLFEIIKFANPYNYSSINHMTWHELSYDHSCAICLTSGVVHNL